MTINLKKALLALLAGTYLAFSAINGLTVLQAEEGPSVTGTTVVSDGTSPIPTQKYSMRLSSEVFAPVFLKHDGDVNYTVDHQYTSSIPRDADGKFYFNNCVQYYIHGHAYGKVTDKLIGEVQWIYKNSPYGTTATVDYLQEIVDWYEAKFADENLFEGADFEAYVDALEDAYGLTTDSARVAFLSYNDGADNGINPTNLTTAVAILDDVGLGVDYNGSTRFTGATVQERMREYYKLILIQIALSASIWHFTDGVELLDAPYFVDNYDDKNFLVAMPDDVKIIYEYYIDHANENYDAVPAGFIMTRTAVNGNEHTYEVNSTDGNNNWNGFTVSLSENLAGTYIKGSGDTQLSSVHLDPDHNTFVVVVDEEEESYKLTGGHFYVSVWYGVETDGIVSTHKDHLQDHAIVLENKVAQATLAMTWTAPPVTPQCDPNNPTDDPLDPNYDPINCPMPPEDPCDPDNPVNDPLDPRYDPENCPVEEEEPCDPTHPTDDPNDPNYDPVNCPVTPKKPPVETGWLPVQTQWVFYGSLCVLIVSLLGTRKRRRKVVKRTVMR
ncbi:MAG: hypothetical protein LBR25_06380 [Erysipelotrichaceae bacterium]|jgi:hypothetical protein|nr:hypothetical protein [Erysipelotrichaceae bacterium]